MSILRKAFKIFNGSSWDEYHLKTDSKQVVHTKADGTDTTVEEQLLTLNSTLTKLTNNTDVSSKYTNFDPSGKFNALDNKSTGWIRMYKNGRLLVFTAALEIKTNFGAWTDYKICDLPYTANGTQYGTAISDSGKVVPLKISANTKTLYISSRNSLLASSPKEWIWCNITILCTE